MNTLVTGGTGFLGRHLIAELTSAGRAVRVLARNAARARQLPDEVEVVPGDLDDEAAVATSMRGIEVVFHLAAATSGNWETHRRVTVEGTRRALAAASAAGVRRFVHVSSIVVYDKRGRSDGAVIDESAALLAPVPDVGAYARGKLEAERIAHAHARARPGMEVVIARPGLVYGPGRLGFNHLGELLGERRLAYGSNSLLLPLVEARSCARALVALGRSNGAAGRTYHIVDAHASSRQDYLDTLARLTGHRLKVAYLPAWPVAAVCGLLGAVARTAGISGAAGLSAAKIRTRAIEFRYDTTALERDTEWRPLPALAPGLAQALGRTGTPTDRPKTATDRPAASTDRPATQAGRRLERVGIVGAGAMARVHLQALRRVPGIRVTGILDTDRAAAENLAREAGSVEAFDDARAFYARARPDVVHVVTPPDQHAAAALAAFDHNAHVLLEKPATTTLDDCDALLAAARARGLTIGVDETVAWDPLVRRAVALAATGVLGELVHIDARMAFDLGRGGRLERILRAPSCWERRLPGGPLEDLLPHSLSVVRALAGPLELEHARACCSGRLAAEFPDELRIELAASGATASIGLSLSSRPDDFLVTIHGTRATVRIDIQNVLFDCMTPIPGPRAASRGLRVLRSGLRTLGQTAGTALAMAIRRAPTPASPVHLIAAHHAALATGGLLPAPLAAARGDIAIARAIWPLQIEPVAAVDLRARAV